MDTVLKHDPAKLAALKQEYESYEDKVDAAQEEYNRILRLQSSSGIKISEMLCPLVIGKLYRLKRESYYNYGERGGWYFKIERLIPPAWSHAKWSAKAVWCRKDGEPRTAFGHGICRFTASQDIIEQIDWEVTE